MSQDKTRGGKHNTDDTQHMMRRTSRDILTDRQPLAGYPITKSNGHMQDLIPNIDCTLASRVLDFYRPSHLFYPFCFCT